MELPFERDPPKGELIRTGLRVSATVSVLIQGSDMRWTYQNECMDAKFPIVLFPLIYALYPVLRDKLVLGPRFILGYHNSFSVNGSNGVMTYSDGDSYRKFYVTIEQLQEIHKYLLFNGYAEQLARGRQLIREFVQRNL
jgi:hypothetical protein